ncbi:MAG: RNA polymerase factor sigma-54 [Oscillospiraceae bacterium]|nr:RNA polymerase factor sigma-54 [Oscillospiraceae bacterium]
MAEPLTLKTEQRQELRLNPQMLLRMKLLQMSALDVSDYVARAAEENPVLEHIPDAELAREYAELRSRAAWLTDIAAPIHIQADAWAPEQGAADLMLSSARMFLFDQLERLRLEEPLLLLCKYLVELLDENGYLAREDVDGLMDMNVPPELGRQALRTLRSLEPAGVGAYDLRDCLLLQLGRTEQASPAALAVVESCLPELGRGQRDAICRKLRISEAELDIAQAQITALDPYPLSTFHAAETAVFARPDVYVVEREDGWPEAVLNRYDMPQFRISAYYSALMKQEGSKELADYLRQKLRDAQALLSGLEQRGATLLRCAQAVVDTQQRFFMGRTEELAPMQLTSLAARLGLSVSTVSRAVSGKYLQCRLGVYPLRYFFSRAMTNGVSRQAVQRRLFALIEQESSAAPLSDQRLAEQLTKSGIPITRRTVAKYRAELRIPAAFQRKKGNRGFGG